MRIIETVATRCQILRLKCTKFDFGWEDYSALPDPLAAFKGLTSRGMEWEGREGEGKGWEVLRLF